MKEFNELLKTAQECANEADALRKAAMGISFKVGEIAQKMGSGYESTNPENMEEFMYRSGEKNVKRIVVRKVYDGKWAAMIETGAFELNNITGHYSDPKVWFYEGTDYTRTIEYCSIDEEIKFFIEKIEGFLNEWYEKIKRLHKKRKAIRLAAEKIKAALQ